MSQTKSILQVDMAGEVHDTVSDRSDVTPSRCPDLEAPARSPDVSVVPPADHQSTPPHSPKAPSTKKKQLLVRREPTTPRSRSPKRSVSPIRHPDQRSLSPKRCRSPKRSPHDSARSLGSHGLGKPIPGKKTLLVPKTAKTPVIAEKKASAVEEISTEIDNSSVEGQSRAINVTDLSVYAGRTLAEKVDSFIDAHPVVMFNRTWCLFSIDAVDFLVNEMRVSVHSLELDVHPKGKEILKYITAKTDHKTTPAIFIRGEFLGGFDQVNALYATGVLERDYLYGLSQADKCDEFLTKSKLSRKPMFWFPETVNAYAIRIGGMITSLSAATAAAIIYWYSWGAYIAYFLALDFFLRVLAGGLISPIGRLAWLFAKCIGNKPRVGRPKQFASCCGLMFAMLGSIFYLLPFYGCNVAGSVFMGGLAIASGMEGFLDFCVGCVIFKFGVQLGAIPK